MWYDPRYNVWIKKIGSSYYFIPGNQHEEPPYHMALWMPITEAGLLRLTLDSEQKYRR
jgi:hypothetical protein